MNQAFVSHFITTPGSHPTGNLKCILHISSFSSASLKVHQHHVASFPSHSCIPSHLFENCARYSPSIYISMSHSQPQDATSPPAPSTSIKTLMQLISKYNNTISSSEFSSQNDAREVQNHILKVINSLSLTFLDSNPSSADLDRAILQTSQGAKWNLLYTTESALISLLDSKLKSRHKKDNAPKSPKKPLLPQFTVKDIYQSWVPLHQDQHIHVQSQKIKDSSMTFENVIKWSINNGPNDLTLKVLSTYLPPEQTRVRFNFRKTTVIWDGWGTLNFPFAVGSGDFRVIYLDHNIRIDKNDNFNWINVYSYAGPALKCDFYLIRSSK